MRSNSGENIDTSLRISLSMLFWTYLYPYPPRQNWRKYYELIWCCSPNLSHHYKFCCGPTHHYLMTHTHTNTHTHTHTHTHTILPIFSGFSSENTPGGGQALGPWVCWRFHQKSSQLCRPAVPSSRASWTGKLKLILEMRGHGEDGVACIQNLMRDEYASLLCGHFCRLLPPLSAHFTNPLY